jgi:hypothetical protein
VPTFVPTFEIGSMDLLIESWCTNVHEESQVSSTTIA